MEEIINVDFFMGTATFFVKQEGSANKTTYSGTFKVKCVMSPMEYINSNALYRKLLGEVNPHYTDKLAERLSYAISQLKYRIVDCPDWFKSQNGMYGSESEDNILLYVFDKCVEAEMQYRDGMEERAKKAKNEAVKTVDAEDEVSIAKKAKDAENEADDLIDDLEE